MPISSQAWQIAICCSLLVLAGSGFALTTTATHPSTTKSSPKPPPPKTVGAAGLLSAAQHELDQGNYDAAAEYARAGAARAPVLNDYAQFLRAEAEYQLKNYKEVDKAVTQVFTFDPLSPLVGRSAAIAVNSNLDSDQPKQALELIQKYLDRIPKPQGYLLYAKCLLANEDLAQAAEYYKRVYYDYPVADEATDAARTLVDVKARMGDAYPPITPALMLERAAKLIQYHHSSDARIELIAAIPSLSGAQRDLAQVRLGELDYFTGKTKDAINYLNNLKVSDADANAERLYYLIECSRRDDKNSNVKPYLDELEQGSPGSTWRLQALIEVADQARYQNEGTLALDLYRTCASVFGRIPEAAPCNWRRAYAAYHSGDKDAGDLLQNFVQQFPETEDTTDALYFLARWYEKNNDIGSARATFDALVLHFPNTYFGLLASERIGSAALKDAVPSETAKTFLNTVTWPQRDRYESFKPGPLAQKRLNRAELLQITGLNDFAEGELRFGARNDDGQSNVYAMQLAKYAIERDAPNEALNDIKTYVPGYLYMPLDQAPPEFWQLAFPIPFRGAIEYFSKQQKLDPYLISALIRQESDFYIKEVSPAHAYGLMQLIPETARSMARHFSIRRVTTSDLETPDLNIQLGTYFLRTLLDRYNGQTEWALAAYNAGPGRPDQWRNWGPFEDTADLVEVIPLHETRLYVQIVQRNANLYRRLYAGTKPDLPPYHPKPPPTAPTKSKKKRHSS